MAELIGLSRERVYSPGRVEDDAAILAAVAAELERRGHSVRLVDGDEEKWPNPQVGTIAFAMAQGPRSLARMEEWQRRGIRVINAPAGILNCQRHRTVPLLNGAEVGFPATVLVRTEAPIEPQIPPPLWVKRGDVHATDPEDVSFASDWRQVGEALAAMRGRGVERAALQRHIDGTVIKFYGVRNGFFHPVPPSGVAGIAPSLCERLQKVAARAARVLEVEIFGGDCVVDRAGGVHIIDLNDWPSYRACRAPAAAAIASYLIDQQTEGSL